MNQVTHILCAVDESSGAEQLLPLVYDELRKLAAQKLAQETPGHTLQPTGKLRRELTCPSRRLLRLHARLQPGRQVPGHGRSRGTIRLWAPTTGEFLRTLPTPGSRLLQVTFSPDSTVLVAARDNGAVQFWDVRTGDFLFALNGGKTTVYCVAFSPNGRLLASSGGERVIRLWDVSKGTLYGELHGHTSDTRCLFFHPDGRTLASAGHDRAVRLWDVATLSAKGALYGHESTVLVGAWRADGAMVITAGETDGAVRLWSPATDPPSCETLKVMPPEMRWAHALALSPEGRHLALTHPNGSTYILRLAKPGEVRRVP